MRLGILCTHPIQYYVPLFRYLAQMDSLDLRVYYCQKPTPEQQGVGFGRTFSWDVDLTTGYEIVWLDNVSKRPHLQKFFGCDTPGIVEIIKKQNFDAFLTLGWYMKSMWQAMLACWLTGTPLLVRGDSHLHVDCGRLKTMAKNLLYPLFIRRFSACLAVGKWSAEYFRHYGARRVVDSPHFVDNIWFAGQAASYGPSINELKSAWGIGPGSVVLLYAGKFEEKKRPMDILHAAAKLLNNGLPKDRFHLLMVGDGQLLGGCRDLATSAGLPVTFAGFLNQTEMPRSYAVADVVILPSDGRETWGLVINEAMACGIPAIVSDRVGCGPDLVEEGKTGGLFPCGDIDALAKKIHDLLSSKMLRTMGIAARQKVINYSVERAAQGVINAIDEVVGYGH